MSKKQFWVITSISTIAIYLGLFLLYSSFSVPPLLTTAVAVTIAVWLCIVYNDIYKTLVKWDE